jgi:hypothetical protein
MNRQKDDRRRAEGPEWTRPASRKRLHGNLSDVDLKAPWFLRAALKENGPIAMLGYLRSPNIATVRSRPA